MNDRPDTYRLQESLPIYDLEPSRELHGERKSILVIEDEEDLNLALSARLRRAGFHVLSCFDARSGLERTGFHKPNLVILDLVLPGMDGFEFLHQMLDVSRLRDIPVVVVTDRLDDDVRAEADRLGVAEILEKPCSHRAVVDVCRDLLDVD